MNGKSYSDFFDDDFEVVYEEDLPEIHLDEDTPESPDDYYDDDYDDEEWEEPRDISEHEKGKKSKNKRSGSKQPGRQKSGSDDRSRKKKKRTPNLVSPVKKTVQTGTRAVMRLIQIVCKIATLLLIAFITYLLGSHFLEGLPAYGNPAAAVAERNYPMAAYAGFALALLLFELVSFLWALTGPRAAKEHGRSFQADTGRGMFSFILVGAGSVLASVSAALIPSSWAALTGLKGAVEIYGSLSSSLIPLCIAGVISCILRKIFSR